MNEAHQAIRKIRFHLIACCLQLQVFLTIDSNFL